MVRRIALAILGVTSVVRGSSYIGPRSPDSSPAQLAFVDHLIPLSWYAVGWIVTGAVALIAVFWRRLQPIGFGFAIAFNLLWAASFLLSQVFLHIPRAYVSATSYIAIAGLAICVAALSERSHPPEIPQGVECRPSE